jgi:hypothetical protein
MNVFPRFGLCYPTELGGGGALISAHKESSLMSKHNSFFSFGATARIWALAYLQETLRFTSVDWILDIR